MLTGGALAEALRLYDLWSRWQSEAPEEILLAHASIHWQHRPRSGAFQAKAGGERRARATLCDLTTTEVSYAVANAFYCGKLVLACSTYDGGLFPPMEEFLSHLQAKGFRDRTVGLMENGSWAPAAARLMRAKLEEMKDLRVCGTVVSLRSALSPASEGADGRADHGAVCRIKVQTADPVWYPTLLPPDTARCIVERRRAL